MIDSGYGVRSNWPSASYTHFSSEFGTIEFEINSHGVRSPREIPYEKPENVFRILGFGDSYTIGYGAKLEETYLEQLQTALQKKSDCKIEVVNLGVSGHGTAEELIALQEEGLKYSPDAVLFQWHATDLQENVRSGLYKVVDGKLSRKNSEYLPAVELREKLFSYAAYRFLAEHSMFYTWLRNKLSRLTQDRLLVAQQKSAPKGKEGSQPSKGQKAEQLSLALLQRAKQTSESAGADFYLFEVPTKVKRTEFRSSFPEENRFNEIRYNPIEDFSYQNGAKLYWEHSAGHFTPLGNKIVGIGLANLINVDCGTTLGN